MAMNTAREQAMLAAVGHPHEDAFMVPGMGAQPRYVAANDNVAPESAVSKRAHAELRSLRESIENSTGKWNLVRDRTATPTAGTGLYIGLRRPPSEDKGQDWSSHDYRQYVTEDDIVTTTFAPLEAVGQHHVNPRPAFDERTGDFMQTYSGRKFWPLDPRADEVHIEDIAHSLSLQCRYAGHCTRFYSVAEHSTLIARWLLAKYGALTAMHGLLHDATEAYLVDMPRPVKRDMPWYKALEERVYRQAIAPRFGLSATLPAAVHEADNRIIADELVLLRPMDWHARHDNPLGVKVVGWSPDAAEDEFLAAYVMLERKLKEDRAGRSSP